MARDRVVLRSDDGREVDLGDEQGVRVARGEIMGLTGGSSSLGRWSYLWDQGRRSLADRRADL